MAIGPKRSITGKIITLFLVLGLALNLLILYAMLHKERETYTSIAQQHYSLIVRLVETNLNHADITEPFQNKIVEDALDFLVKGENFLAVRLYSRTGNLVYEAGKPANPASKQIDPQLSPSELDLLVQELMGENSDQAQPLPIELFEKTTPSSFIFPITQSNTPSIPPTTPTLTPATTTPTTPTTPTPNPNATTTTWANNGDVLGIVEIVPSENNPLTAFRKYSTTGFIAGGIIFLILLLTITIAIYMWVEQPLRIIAKSVNKAETDDFMFRMPKLNSEDQIGFLAASFNRMLIKITDLRAGLIDTDMSLQTEVAHKNRFEQKNLKFEQTNKQLAASIKNMELLMGLTRNLIASLDLNTVIQELVHVLSNQMEIPRFILLLSGDSLGSGQLAESVAYHGMPSINSEQLKLAMEGVAKKIIDTGKMVSTPDLSREPEFKLSAPLHGSEGSMLALPIKSELGLFGVLICNRPAISAFDESEHKLLQAIADGTSLAISNCLLYQRSMACSRKTDADQ